MMMRVTAEFSCVRLYAILVASLLSIAGAARSSHAAPSNITFSQSADTVEAYDFIEVTLKVASPDARNPFTDVTVEGQFGKNTGLQRLSVTGFCDAADGSVYRIRFMPSSP